MIELFLSGLPIMSDPDSSSFKETWIWPWTETLILFLKETWIWPWTETLILFPKETWIWPRTETLILFPKETWIWPQTGALILFPKETWIWPRTGAMILFPKETWIWPRTETLFFFPKETWIWPQTRFCELVRVKFISVYWTDTRAMSANFIMSLHKPRLRGTENVPHFVLPWGQPDTNGFTWPKVWFRTIRPSLLPHKFQLSSSSSSLCSPLYWIGTYSKFKKFRQVFQLKIKEDYVIVFFVTEKESHFFTQLTDGYIVKSSVIVMHSSYLLTLKKKRTTKKQKTLLLLLYVHIFPCSSALFSFCHII